MSVRAATAEDHDAIWAIIEPIVRAGETYALPRDWRRDEALAYWMSGEKDVFVYDDGGRVLGTYFFRANNPGPGDHVGNCGYMVHPEAYGRGVARAMGEHSIAHARTRGFRAIQFNFVVSSNERAVRLWQSLGFEIAGTLPGAFRHPALGYVDAYVMYQQLASGD